MMDRELLWVVLSVVLALLAVGVALVRTWRTGEPVSLPSVRETLTEVERAAGAARELVLAAEQLYETGRLVKDERFDWVLARLATVHPAMDYDTLTWAIEAAVQGLKLARGARQG